MKEIAERLEILLFRDLRWNNTAKAAWLSGLFHREIHRTEDLTETETHMAVGYARALLRGETLVEGAAA